MLVHIVPAEETYFVRLAKPTRVSLTRDIVAMNYSNKSPFPDGDFLYCESDTDLQLWFTRSPLPTTKRICIPESYLIAKQFPGRDAAILICPRTSGTLFLVFREGDLVGQTFTPATSKTESNAEMADLLAREYSLPDPDIIEHHETNLRPALHDMYVFGRPHFNWHETTRRTFMALATGAIVVLLIFGGYDLMTAYTLRKYVNRRQARLAGLKKANLPLKSEIADAEKQAAFWSSFVENEITGVSFPRVLDVTARVLSKRGGSINNLSYSRNSIAVWISIPGSSADMIQALMQTGEFSSARILTSSEDPKDPARQLLQLELSLQSSATAQSERGQAVP